MTAVRQLLWSTFLPWVRVPGAPVYGPVDAPADLPGYRPYVADHELPGSTVDDIRARKVCTRILAAEPERTAEAAALLDRLGLAHRDAGDWTAVGEWLRDRAADAATPSLVLDVGLLLGRRIVEARDAARWLPDDDSTLAHPFIVLGLTPIALPLQAAEAGADLGAVLTTALEAQEETDDAEEFDESA